MTRSLPTSQSTLRRFLAEPTIAIVGASQDPQHFSREVARAFERAGTRVLFVNPRMEADGHTVFSSIGDLPKQVRAALIMVAPAAAMELVDQCVRSDIEQVWLFNGPGGRSDSAAAARAKRSGLSVVADQCPLMFIGEDHWVHRLHAFGKKVLGRYPTAA